MRITPHHRFVKRQREDDDEDPRPTRTTTRPPASPTPDRDDDDDDVSTTTRRTTTSTRRPTRSSTKPSKPTSTKGSGKGSTSGAHPTATLPAGSSQPESSSTRALIGVGASVAAVLAVAVALWFLRKWLLKRHAAKHGAWRASVHDQLEAKRSTVLAPTVPLEKEKEDPNSLRPLISDPKTVDTPLTPAFPAPPEPAAIPESLRPATPPEPQAIAGAAPSISITSPGATPPAVVTQSSVAPAAGPRREAAMVIRAFVPTLTDELPVSIGETVFIVEAFSDGWCSCETIGGQSGVVPLECLQSMSRQPRPEALAQQDAGTDWRTSKRHSSLYGGMRVSGTY